MTDILLRLEETITSRVEQQDSHDSHTWRTYKKGPLKCAEKFGEEAIEAIIAAASGQRKELISETADCLFHLLIMLKANDVTLSEVYNELERREGTSGVWEKENRGAND